MSDRAELTYDTMTDLTASAPEVTAAALSLIPPAPRSIRVFHVNDSTDDQVVFQAACRKAGVPFDWHVTDSAEKGISYLKTLVEQSKSLPVCWPELVLLDIIMPIVSGFEVLKFIRSTKELKHLPVSVFTGNTYPPKRTGITAARSRCPPPEATHFY